tara:strand:+ start:3746 stop:3922 length:177 start_codon:yes stop_codon:yes gene_type:complete
MEGPQAGFRTTAHKETCANALATNMILQTLTVCLSDLQFEEIREQYKFLEMKSKREKF